MKTLRYIFAALALTMGLAACQKEEATSVYETPTQKQEKLVPVTICASMGQQTKTALDATDKSKINWSEGDKINITIGDETCVFTLIRGAGETAGTFNAEVSETFHDALFNSATSATASYPITGTDVKATQTYADGSFATDTFPMTGDVACGENPSISFTSSAAIVKIAGITAEESSSAILSYGSGESDKISMTFDSAISGKDLYFVVPTGKTDFNLTIGSETRYFASLAVATEACHGYTLEKAVAKIGTTGYTTVLDAISAANSTDSGATIDLLEDAPLGDYMVEILKDIDFNLGGHTLFVDEGSSSASAFAFEMCEAGVSFSIHDGNIADKLGNGDSWGVILLNASGSTALTMKNVKIGGVTEGVFDENKQYYTWGGGIIKSETSYCQVITLDNVTAVTDNTIVYGSVDGKYASSKLSVMGGKYMAKTGFWFYSYDFVNGQDVTSEIKGAEITVSPTDSDHGAIVGYCGTINVENTTISSTCICNGISSGYGTTTLKNNTVSVGGSAVTAEGNEGFVNIVSGSYSGAYGAYVRTSGGTINVSGGTVTGSTKALFAATAAGVSTQSSIINVSGDAVVDGSLQTSSNNAQINIAGGTFKKAIASGDIENGSTISGGTFYEAAPYEGYIASGYNVVANEGTPSTWSVVKSE